MACIEIQSIVIEDKQNYYHPLPVSVSSLNVNDIVGRDSRELCHLGPFFVVRQYKLIVIHVLKLSIIQVDNQKNSYLSFISNMHFERYE